MNNNLALNPQVILPQPDSGVLKALARLSDNSDFVTLCEHLETCIQEQDKKNRATRDDVPLRQGQGICQALESVLTQAYTAKDALKKTV